MAIRNIDIPGNDFVIEAKQKSLEKLAKLDHNVLQKLADLSGSKKAIDTLMNPPTLMKSFLGIK